MKFFSNTFSAKKLWGCVGGRNKRDQFAWKIEKSYILFWLRLRWFEANKYFFSGKIHFFFGTISENFFFLSHKLQQQISFSILKIVLTVTPLKTEKYFDTGETNNFLLSFVCQESVQLDSGQVLYKIND